MGTSREDDREQKEIKDEEQKNEGKEEEKSGGQTAEEEEIKKFLDDIGHQEDKKNTYILYRTINNYGVMAGDDARFEDIRIRDSEKMKNSRKSGNLFDDKEALNNWLDENYGSYCMALMIAVAAFDSLPYIWVVQAADKLLEEIELLDGASAEFDLEAVRAGDLTPVCFGSALTNFGVEIFLKHFLDMATTPLPRRADIGLVDPAENGFSAFVFKIQANMNKAHRDRIAFMRICSGRFDANMEVRHVQGGKVMRLSQPQQIMADERKILSEAYAGDIIGVFDPGIFSIGDTICCPKEKFRYEGIPTFAPEHFARVRQMDTMKRKQFVKGIEQIAQEGAIQIFQEFNSGFEEIIVGVVGVLQFDVLKYRLENEYNVEIRLENLPYEHIRWIGNKDEIDIEKLSGTSDMKKVRDMKGNPLLLFVNSWSIGMTMDRNKGLVLAEFGSPS
mgnify:CR=1 FL=1